jgi:cell shape-determining protein MreC
MLFTWGMLTGLIFLFAVPQETSDRLQLTYARVFRWPLQLGHSLTLAARSTALPPGVTPEQYEALLANHRQIQTKIANLQGQLQDARQQIEKLAKLREKPGWENMDFRLARVIRAADPAQSGLIIDRGTEHGVAVGQFVLGLNHPGDVDQSESVIGTVSSVDTRTARVKLITDPGDPKIIVGIGTLSVRGFMEGRGNGAARITNVQTEHKVARDDPVYAQKVQGLDVPIVAARVTQCRTDPEEPFFLDITVEPVCDIAALSDVAVVVAAVPAK